MFGLDQLNTSSPPQREAQLFAKLRSDTYRRKKKQAHDEIHKPLQLKPGDLVKRRIPSNRPDVRKLTPRYEGPFAVVELRGPVDAHIRLQRPNSTPILVHVSQLEPHFTRVSVLQNAGE